MRTVLICLIPAALACSDGGDKPDAGGDTASGPGDDASSTTDTTTPGDADGDGFTTEDGDCDDTNASVYPGGSDTSVDGVDQDCDGLDGPDADGDGYVDAAAGGDDCDDTDSSTYPDATETWDDGIDQDCDGEADVEDALCSADLTVTLPDGTTTALDFCAEWDFSATFEYDPDDPPEVTALNVSLSATTEVDFECEVRLSQEAVCGTGFYSQLDGAASTTLVLVDCSGVADEYEETVVLSEGYLRLDTIDTGTDTGSFSGQPLPTTLTGHIHAWGSGVDLEGPIELSLRQIAGDSEETDDCAVSDGDLDDDGQLALNFDGEDCDDTDPLTFAGAAALEDPAACMTDGDGDGWGAAEVADGVTVGTDCADTDPLTFPGAAATEDPTACMTDADADGWGALTPAEGVTAGTDCDDTSATLNLDDADADGVTTCESDCDDTNAGAYPGAALEELELCTIDADGDGWGDAAVVAPLEAGTDCDDGDAATLPGAASEEPALCTIDADGDGWGNRGAASPVEAGSDCNDADSAAYPGAVTEASSTECMLDADGDGYGDDAPSALYDPGTDCDDTDDTLHPNIALYEWTLCTIDADGDGFGDESAAAPADAGTDCDDADPDINPLEDDGIWDIDRNCDGRLRGSLDGADYAIMGEDSRDRVGEVVAAGGDLDGDGFDDLVFSQQEYDGTGRVYVFFGGNLGSTAELDASDADFIVDGENNNDHLGGGIAVTDDFDGDGMSELAIGVTRQNVEVKDDGLVLLFFSETLRTSASIDPSDADARFWGEAESDLLGSAINGISDVDNDGHADLWLFASGNDDGGDNTGKAYLFYGSDLEDGGDFDTTDASVSVAGAADSAGEGGVLATGDLDADGLDDLAIGVPEDDDAGADAGQVFVVLGSTLATATTLDHSSADHGFTGEAAADDVHRLIGRVRGHGAPYTPGCRLAKPRVGS